MYCPFLVFLEDVLDHIWSPLGSVWLHCPELALYYSPIHQSISQLQSCCNGEMTISTLIQTYSDDYSLVKETISGVVTRLFLGWLFGLWKTPLMDQMKDWYHGKKIRKDSKVLTGSEVSTTNNKLCVLCVGLHLNHLQVIMYHNFNTQRL